MKFPPRTDPRRAAGTSRWLTAWVLVSAGLGGSAPAADKEPPAKPATAPSSANAAASWKSLFDGKSLAGWKITDFAGHGEVRVKDGKILLQTGVMTGITWTNDLFRTNYEISLEAMRVEGNDFFCGLT